MKCPESPSSSTTVLPVEGRRGNQGNGAYVLLSDPSCTAEPNARRLLIDGLELLVHHVGRHDSVTVLRATQDREFTSINEKA